MSLAIYKDVRVINREEDKKLKVSPIEGFSYASNMRDCIITGTEFYAAAKSQPIVFTKNENGEYMALALMGLISEKNLFTNEDGSWRVGEYVPAFVRRYPFIYIQHSGDSLTLAVDHGHKAVNKRKGEALFNADGEPSAYTQRVMDFLSQYQEASIRTQAMIKLLDDKGLLEDATAKLVQNGEPATLTGFKRVNEEKLSELSDTDILELIKSGVYKWIVAHLMSLSNFKKLLTYSEQ
jgi:hypothetical protein